VSATIIPFPLQQTDEEIAQSLVDRFMERKCGAGEEPGVRPEALVRMVLRNHTRAELIEALRRG
jgi:hypothetical protein